MYRFLSILHLTGAAMVLFSFSTLAPLAVSWYTDDGSVHAFMESFLLALAPGLLLFVATRRFQRELQPRDGFLLVSLVWTVLPLLATIPFLLYFERVGAPIGFTHAYFEAMSGLTTTGSTVLTGLELLPPSIHVWRGTLIWIGAMGILVLTVAILPLLGVGGSQVVRAETPGPMKDDKLTPRIAGTAKALYAVFLGISLLCWCGYLLAGMNLLDAFVHMCATVGLGGFSTRDASIGAFDSFGVELVAMLFMLVSGINFATHFSAWRSRGLGSYRRCPETRYFLALALGSGLAVSAFLYFQSVYDNPWDALRYGMFNTISVATTTGFASTDYAVWPLFAPVLMLLMSCFTASSGSTGSGIKLIRFLLLVKQAKYELLRLVHPRAIAPVRLSNRIVDTRVLHGVMAFLVLYIAMLALMSLILLFSGLDAKTAFTAALSSLNNTGPGLGSIGPAGTYASLSDFQVWVCTAGMLLGRLELVTILVLFTPAFWRN